MAERVYTEYERELALWAAEREGDKSAAQAFGVPESTIRSWRMRAARKVVDNRASRDDEDAARQRYDSRVESTIAGLPVVDVMIPADEFDGALWRQRKAPAKAKVLERFSIGAELMSTAPPRTTGRSRV